jgi:hypothetical protein
MPFEVRRENRCDEIGIIPPFIVGNCFLKKEILHFTDMIIIAFLKNGIACESPDVLGWYIVISSMIMIAGFPCSISKSSSD